MRPADDAEVIASWDFRGCKDGWSPASIAGTTWVCGRIVRGPGGDRTGEGDGWGVGMTEPPAGRTETTLTSPEIDLGGSNDTVFTLSVWHWLDGEALPGPRDSGGGLLEVSDPQTNRWVAVEPIGGYDGPVVAPGTALDGQPGFTDRRIERVWRRSFFDLSRWAGLAIRVRFHAGLGTNTPGDGWFVDDVQVYRGGVVEDVIDTDLSTCGAGAVIRFPFRTCDEGFGARGSGSSWACGPATRLDDYPEAPVGDGPQFDVDASGLLFATAPSGLYNPAEVSELVSPPMDLSGCPGRTTSLSFWHWYHFAPGAGGWVEVWDGRQWVEVVPTRGYGGPVRLAPLAAGGRHDGFVTPEDRPSGWRFEVFDVSAYVHGELRVRFRFLGGLARRPGWYIDTVAVSTSGLEGLPRFDGNPSVPGCGFAAAPYQSPDAGLVVPEPCVAGTPIVPGRTVWVGATDHASAIAGAAQDRSGKESVEFDVPQEGAVCVALFNGAADRRSRVASGSVYLDGQPLIDNQRFNDRHTVIRERRPVAPGKHVLTFEASGKPTEGTTDPTPALTEFSFQVLFQAGKAMPVEFPRAPDVPPQDATVRPGRPAIAATNFSLARAPSGRAGKLEYAGEVPAVGPGPQTYALRYVIQLADPRTCKQVRELRGLYPISTATTAGWEDVLASPGLWWDGRDDRGRPVHSQALFVRGWLSVDLAGLDLLPPLPPAETEPRGPVPIDPDPPIPIDPAPVIDRSVIPGPELARLRLGNAWMAIQALINRPHPDYVGNVFACGRETPSAPIEAPPSCAPSADWPLFRATRSIPIVCGACGMTIPPPAEISRRWQVRFRQGADWLIGFSLPVGARPGWWFSGDLPEVPPTSGIPGPVAGASVEAIVSYTDTAPGDLGSITEVTRVPFTFRGPTVARVESPDGDATFTPGERIRVFGHLLATYRVRFALAQTSGGATTTLARFAAPTDEPATGAYTATLDDVMVQGDVPPDAAAVVGPAQVVATAGLADVDVAGSPSGMEVVPKTCDREHEHLVPGSEDSCEPYSGRLHDRYYADTTADPFCRHLLEDTTTCVYGCSTGGGNHVALASLDVRNAACISRDPDFGNPCEVGSFGGEADRCEGDVLIEVVPPSSPGGPHRSIVCSHGCSAGACNCPATPVPITVGCLPFDWPVPPAGEEALYRRVFSAACRERVADFAYASGLDGTRCYRVVPMWFPEHWSDHPRWIGSDGSSAGNPSWPYRALDRNLVAALHGYWTREVANAVAAGCTGGSAYLCAYRDVNVWLGVAGWRWGDYGGCPPGACGSVAFIGELLSAAIASPKSVPHELGHLFGWMEAVSGRWNMLCEEYDNCVYREQAAGVACGNDEPPSEASGGWWTEEDATCTLQPLSMCPDGTFGRTWPSCLGAPLGPRLGASTDRADHCIMGLGTVGFCNRCRAFLEDAFTRWESR